MSREQEGLKAVHPVLAVLAHRHGQLPAHEVARVEAEPADDEGIEALNAHLAPILFQQGVGLLA